MEPIILDETITRTISDMKIGSDIVGYGFKDANGTYYIQQCLLIEKPMTAALALCQFDSASYRTYPMLVCITQNTALHPAAFGSFGGEVLKQDICAYVNNNDRRMKE